MKKSKSLLKNQLGFSLIEIMIVLGLIGGIVALIASRVGNSQQNAMVKTTKLTIRQTMDLLEQYNQDCNSYPTSSQGLAALVKQPGGEPPCESWGPQPYSKDIPRDAWGSALAYESDGTDFEIISYGKDKKPGGEGVAKDISSKNLDKK